MRTAICARLALSSDRIRLRVTAKDFHKRTVLLQFPDCIFDQFVFAMTFDIDEKEVFPVFPLRWPALDLAHTQLEAIEWFNRRV